MSALAGACNLFAPDQFRMSRLQIFNWGTFSDIHDIPITAPVFCLWAAPARANRRCSTRFPRCWCRRVGPISTRQRGRRKRPGAIATW